MSAKAEADKKSPNYPWTVRQKRMKLGNRKSRKQYHLKVRK